MPCPQPCRHSRQSSVGLRHCVRLGGCGDIHTPPRGFHPTHSGCPLLGSNLFCHPASPAPMPCPPPCGCAESTSRFRATTWGSFSLRRWGWQPPSASCHPTPPFGRGWVTLRFRVFGGRHRLLLLSVVSRVTIRYASGHPSHYSAPQVTKPAISPKTLAAANPSFLREKLHPLRSAPTARRFRHSHIHPPPLGAFLPPIRDAPCLHGGVLPRTCPLARSRTLLPASQILALSLHFAYCVAAARPSARVESRFQWQVRRVRAIPLLRRGIAPTRFFALAAGGILPVATALAAPPAFGSAPSKRKGLRHSRPPPSGAFLPTHSGCFIYIPSFCEATGCKNRLMLATIEQRGTRLQTRLCKTPTHYVCRLLLTLFNKTDILNKTEIEKIQNLPNSDSTPTQLRFLSVHRFFLLLHPFEVYPKGAASMVPPHWRQTKHPYFLCQKVICYSVMLAVRSAPWCSHAPMVSRLSARKLMWLRTH